MLRRLEVEEWDKERMKHFYYGGWRASLSLGVLAQVQPLQALISCIVVTPQRRAAPGAWAWRSHQPSVLKRLTLNPH